MSPARDILTIFVIYAHTMEWYSWMGHFCYRQHWFGSVKASSTLIEENYHMKFRKNIVTCKSYRVVYIPHSSEVSKLLKQNQSIVFKGTFKWGK